MTSVDQHSESAAARPAASPVPAAASQPAWGNAAPLGLTAFAVTTFILSMINTHIINVGTEPVAFGVAFMYGGLAQLIAGVICFRNGNTFTGVLFGTFGAFWLSLFAIAEFELKSIPPAQVGHALGLFLYAFGIAAFMLFVASFRTNAVVVASIGVLTIALFVLGAGNYSLGLGQATNGLIKFGGWLGLAAALGAFYLALGEVCEFTYGRVILPVVPLAKR